MKSTSLAEILALIGPLLLTKLRLLVIMNGLVEDDLTDMIRTGHHETTGLDGLGCRAIYGCMALICSKRTSPGMISHSYGGKLVCGVANSANAEGDAGGIEGNSSG